MAAINVETVKAHATLSWAAIVKGGESQAPAESAGDAVAERAALSPGLRGSRTCECRGQVLMMLAYYGWIVPLQDIEHPDADKHEGHIYVKSTDVAGGAKLAPGQIVSFYLYADDQGLGAEDCRPEGFSGAAEFCFRAAAQEFVPTAGTRCVLPASAQKARDAADADTDLSSDAGGDSEDLASDSEDSICGLRGGWPQRRPRDGVGAASGGTGRAQHCPGTPGQHGPGPATVGTAFAQAINLDNYEEDSEPDTEACWEVIAVPPPAVPEDGGIGFAPWRSHRAPPGLERATPGWRLACPEDGTSWPRDLPWRRL